MAVNPQLVQAIQTEIAQCQEEGLGEGDIQWMAQGAAIRYGREIGVIGEEVSPEMSAAIAQAVKKELAK